MGFLKFFLQTLFIGYSHFWRKSSLQDDVLKLIFVIPSAFHFGSSWEKLVVRHFLPRELYFYHSNKYPKTNKSQHGLRDCSWLKIAMVPPKQLNSQHTCERTIHNSSSKVSQTSVPYRDLHSCVHTHTKTHMSTQLKINLKNNKHIKEKQSYFASHSQPANPFALV